jgi:hypothetical protein
MNSRSFRLGFALIIVFQLISDGAPSTNSISENQAPPANWRKCRGRAPWDHAAVLKGTGGQQRRRRRNEAWPWSLAMEL